MLCFLLAPESDLPDENKVNIIKRLFCLKEKPTKVMDVISEFNSIDLIIITEKEVYVIENKIKSDLHSNQLFRYVNVVEKNIESLGPSRNPVKFFGLLSLIEFPLSYPWINLSYSNLLLELKAIIKTTKKLRIKTLINEYIESLEKLIIVKNNFLKEHFLYTNVFQDCSKKKLELLIISKDNNLTPEQRYISLLGLHTILQKVLYWDISRSIEIVEDYIVAETHGTALIQIDIEKIVYNKDIFILGLQIQGSSYKINLVRENSKVALPEKLQNWFNDQFINKNGYNRFNRGRIGHYCSVSKKANEEIEKMNKNKIVKVWKEEYNLSKNLIKNAILALKSDIA
jgi:hypothetical protein